MTIGDRFAPYALRDRVDAQGRVRREREHREHRALLHATEAQCRIVVVPDLERPQHTYVHDGADGSGRPQPPGRSTDVAWNFAPGMPDAGIAHPDEEDPM